MSRSLSNSQIERLGQRLVARPQPAAEDLVLLNELLSNYSDVLDLAVDRVQSTANIAPAFRIKNTGTILEKLRRMGGDRLRNVNDLAGMRIVQSFDRAGQDRLAGELVELFSAEERAPKLIDRRAEPNNGYRAVHLIVFPERTPVEIQIRTSWQHEWAELFEKLADLLGRGIRYGEPPQPRSAGGASEGARRGVAEALERVDADLVRQARVIADLIDAAESDLQHKPLRNTMEEVLVTFGELVDLLAIAGSLLDS